MDLLPQFFAGMIVCTLSSVTMDTMTANLSLKYVQYRDMRPHEVSVKGVLRGTIYLNGR
jgi:hypothetical protein